MFIPLSSAICRSAISWGLGEEGWLREEAATVYSLLIKAEKISYGPCAPADTLVLRGLLWVFSEAQWVAGKK